MRQRSWTTRWLAIGVAAAGAVGGLAALRRRRRHEAPATERTVIAEVEERYTCTCGAEYRVSGAGRHRVFWVVDASADDPVLEDRCPACERPWPEEVAAA
jgi:hypothetical protein